MEKIERCTYVHTNAGYGQELARWPIVGYISIELHVVLIKLQEGSERLKLDLIGSGPELQGLSKKFANSRLLYLN